MSDQQNPPTGLQLPASAIEQLKNNVKQAEQFLSQWDTLEKMGVTLPGTKEQLQAVKDLSNQILSTFTQEGS